MEVSRNSDELHSEIGSSERTSESEAGVVLTAPKPGCYKHELARRLVLQHGTLPNILTRHTSKHTFTTLEQL